MPPRVNPYAVSHKVTRHLLYDACQKIGRTDLQSDDECKDALDAFLKAIFFLQVHGKQEDEVFHPSLRERAPDVEESLAADHQELDPVLEALKTQVEAFGRAQGAARYPAAAELLEAWNDFTARYSAHLRQEETEGTRAWHQHFTDEELIGIIGRAQAALSPEVMAKILPMTLPVVSPEEAAVAYNGVRRRGSPAAVDGFERAAARILGEARWQIVRDRAERMRS